MRRIDVTELAQRIAQGDAPVLLDVREPWEFELCQIPGSRSMPMAWIPARCHELDEEAEVVCICHHGMRSAQVAAFLEAQGFKNIVNLTGGVDAWAREIDSAMAVY